MNEESRRLGKQLQERRKERSLSLKEIENTMSIRVDLLAAIEEGEIASFVAPIYAQGFTKQYATFLGFDQEELMRENPVAFQSVSEKHDFAYGIGTLEMRGELSKETKWVPIILWSALGLGALGLAWFLVKLLKLF